jgi:hypothetical protein
MLVDGFSINERHLAMYQMFPYPQVVATVAWTFFKIKNGTSSNQGLVLSRASIPNLQVRSLAQENWQPRRLIYQLLQEMMQTGS